MDFPRLSKSEFVQDCLQNLDRVVTDLKHDWLAAGLSVAEAAPVAHATDNNGKHRNKLRAFYDSKFSELHWPVNSASAKAEATGAQHVHFHYRSTLPTGDTGHDTCAFCCVTAVGANDTEELPYDHADLM